MSQVNWGVQRNLWMEYAKRNKLTSHERVLYDAIVHVANMWSQRSINHEWPDGFFTVSNSEAEDYSGLNERAIRDTRNRLKQRGLIDFRAGDGKKSNPKYQLHYLRVIGCEIVPDSVPDNVGDSVGDNVCDTVCDHAGGSGCDDGSGPGNVIPVGRVININNKASAFTTSTSNAGEDVDGQDVEPTDEYERLWIESGYRLTEEAHKGIKELEKQYTGNAIRESIRITKDHSPGHPLAYLKKTIIGVAEQIRQSARRNPACNFTQREYTASDEMEEMDRMMKQMIEDGAESAEL